MEKTTTLKIEEMEKTTFLNFKELNEELFKKITSLDIKDQLKTDLLEKIEKILKIDGKINLIFFGSLSSGKTTSINLLLNQFLNKEKDEKNLNSIDCPNLSDDVFNKEIDQKSMNIDSAECPFTSYEEQENFQLISAEAENTYFFTFVETSENFNFRISLNISDYEKEFFINKKKMKFEIKNEGGFYLIEKEFPDTQEGIIELNTMLENLDKIAMPLLEKSREKDINDDENYKIKVKEQKDKEEENIRIPIIKIQVPNFPKEYRLIDTPGLSIKTIEKNIQRMLNNEFNGFNAYIFLQDMNCQTTYNIDYKILKSVNDFGYPIVYCFYTKGKKFIDKLNGKKNEKNKYKKKEAIRDRQKSLIINKQFFNRIEKLKDNDIYFRKVIPIVDADYQNEDVKRCIDIFLEDVKKQNDEYGQICLEKTIMIKLSKLIMQFNDKTSDIKLLNENDLKKMESHFKEINDKREKELREYFADFDEFENYCNKYSDHISELEQIYKNNDKNNPHNFVRSKYIEKHMKDAFEDFKKLILKKPDEITIKFINEYYENLNTEIKEKINERLLFLQQKTLFH